MEPMSGLRMEQQHQEPQERWKELCARAAVEQDSEKLVELTREINRLLEQQEDQARSQRKSPEGQ